MIRNDGYITGVGRSPEEARNRVTHLYEGPFHDPGRPLCRRGWNRDDGRGYSIWRNNVSEKGICKVCQRRADAGLPGVDAKPGAFDEFDESTEAP